MSEHRTDSDTAPSETRIEFGRTLQLAREQAGLSIESVAAELNLTENTVEAIENSDMSRLPPAAFVRGYIRAYARVIDFDVEKLLRDFDNSVPYAHEAELHPLSSLPLETSSQTPLIRLVTGLIAIIALLVLFYGAYSYYSRKSEDMEQAAVTDTGRVQLPPEAPLGIERDAGFENAALMAADTEAMRDEADSGGEPAAAETLVDEDAQTPAMAMPVPAQTQPQPTEPVALQPEAVTPAAGPAADGDVLVLEAGADCWTEIRDATGERKFYGSLGQGRTRTLTGVAPFDIFLGNAPAVRVTLNDVSIDTTGHTRSNHIAHFKVSVENGRVRFH